MHSWCPHPARSHRRAAERARARDRAGCTMLFRLKLLLAALAVLVPLSAARAFETAAKAAIIIDFRTGAVLFEKNADERMPPASMSKLMTAYMVFDRLK